VIEEKTFVPRISNKIATSAKEKTCNKGGKKPSSAVKGAGGKSTGMLYEKKQTRVDEKTWGVNLLSGSGEPDDNPENER